MSNFLAELIGTMMLITLGNGVVANTLLRKTKGQNSGWMMISAGWAIAVLLPVAIFRHISGAHFNPAVTIGLALIGRFPWSQVPSYIEAQFIGAFLGAIVVWIYFIKHFEATEDKDIKLGVFATGPSIRNNFFNFTCEFINTFILMFGILGIGQAKMPDGIGSFLVGVLIWIIVALGGTTGAAMNPARDLGPRIAHFVLPVAGKGDSDWGYAWIPVVAPMFGGVAAALIFSIIS